MYYPYLRGRQFELLALRDFAESLRGNTSNIFPIIEPVRNNKNALKKAAATMSSSSMHYGIILNPTNGECKGKWLDFPEEDDSYNNADWYPTFIVENNIVKINQVIEEKQYSNVILILPKTASAKEEDIIALAKREEVSKIITDTPRRRIKQAVIVSNKEIITLSDRFGAKSANKEYINITEELFSEEFAYYKQDGYNGFADYTVIPNDFREGGVLPNVVAIHLTYQKEEDQIYVKHFCSDSNINDNSNIQGKFYEAAIKAINFFDNNPKDDSPAIDILRHNVTNASFPGLGMIKKISILHHLFLIQRILLSIKL